MSSTQPAAFARPAGRHRAVIATSLSVMIVVLWLATAAVMVVARLAGYAELAFLGLGIALLASFATLVFAPVSIVLAVWSLARREPRGTAPACASLIIQAAVVAFWLIWWAYASA